MGQDKEGRGYPDERAEAELRKVYRVALLVSLWGEHCTVFSVA